MDKPELQRSCASDSLTAIAANTANNLMAIAQELEEIKELLKPDGSLWKTVAEMTPGTT